MSTNGGKEKDPFVKPQNMGGRAERTQCSLFKQIGYPSLDMSHLCSQTSFMHRVIHRSWGGQHKVCQVLA